VWRLDGASARCLGRSEAEVVLVERLDIEVMADEVDDGQKRFVRGIAGGFFCCTERGVRVARARPERVMD